jgi:hypothetical protein
VLDGQPVADTDLRPVWRNITSSPLATNDSPIYEQLFRRVRAINWPLPPSKRIRVLLADPPIDWSKITTQQQVLTFLSKRTTDAVSLIEQQVLARGRRALLHFGGYHLRHGADEITGVIQQQTGVRTYVIQDLVPVAGDPDLVKALTLLRG